MPEREVDGLLLDIDGTLLDTREFIFQAYEVTLARHGLSPTSREFLASINGKTLEECYQILAPNIDPNVLCEDHRVFQTANLQLSVPFPGVLEVVRELRESDISLAAITSRSRRTSLQTLQLAGLEDYFGAVISLEDVSRPKPDPEPLLKALFLLKLPPDRALMVGDTASDVTAGKRAGIRTVGVSYGFGGLLLEQTHPDYFIHNIRDLLGIVR